MKFNEEEVEYRCNIHHVIKIMSKGNYLMKFIERRSYTQIITRSSSSLILGVMNITAQPNELFKISRPS